MSFLGRGHISKRPPTADAWDVMFGDGSEGDVILSSPTTLTKDRHFLNLTVNAGVSINTSGYRIFVKQLLLNNGTLHTDGDTAGVPTYRTPGGGYGGTTFGSNTLQALGGTGGLAGAGITAPAGTGGLGGAGGAGGAGAAGAGGGGGTIAQMDSTQRGGFPRLVGHVMFNMFQNDPSEFDHAGGCGGGGGGSGAVGGGGGAGPGGKIYIASRYIINNGVIRSHGGNGSQSDPAGNGGGGGGGGGGIAYILSRSYFGNPLTVLAGSGGAKNGTGVVGVAGSVGTALVGTL